MSVNDYDEDLYLAIQDLVDEGYLEKSTPAYGVAQQVICTGYDSLTDRQRWTYDAYVVPALRKRGEELRIVQIVNSAPE